MFCEHLDPRRFTVAGRKSPHPVNLTYTIAQALQKTNESILKISYFQTKRYLHYAAFMDKKGTMS